MERLDRFMARANAAYYAAHDPFRDFTTAPEITQVFGELMGAWTAIVWQAMGRPNPLVLAELGPGRGTLMRDALRTLDAVAPDCAAALSLHLVETSPRLRAAQAGLPAVWHERLETLPPGPAIVLANEFLDALPIRQFVRRDGSWRERWVADGSWLERDPDMDLPDAADGTVVERAEAASATVSALAHRLARSNGAALFLDYGAAGAGPADTLQALRNGSPADPLAAPGEADLTAHVDFGALAETARAAGAAVHGPEPQGMFLTRLGLFQRTDRLARTQPPARASALIEAARRLVEPTHMGRLFKAFALAHPALPVLPGFA